MTTQSLSLMSQELDVLKFSFGAHISELGRRHGEHFQWFMNDSIEGLNWRVDALIAGKGPEEVRVRDSKGVHREFAWPETWWDAFKLRWFPGWALKRWPPRMHKEVIHETLEVDQIVNVFALFPTLPVKIGQHVVRYHTEEPCRI